MSGSLATSIIKATKGEYDISLKGIWLETWQQLLRMPKTFWQAFGLIILILLGTSVLLFNWIYFFVHYFSSHNLPSPVTRAFIPAYLSFLGIAILEIFRFLLTTSLVFLVLQHIRTQPTKVTMVFAFLKNWKNLLLISVLFYLVRGGVDLLNLLLPQGASKSIIALVYGLRGFLVIFLYTYFMLVAFMASLLILDQKLTFKKSIGVAFKSINQHVLKNIALLFLASWAYIGAWSDLFSIQNGFGLYFYYLVLLPVLILAFLFAMYKIILKNKPSQVQTITLMLLRIILGLFILVLFFLGGGLIGLLPVIALLLAIQYQHIFIG